MSEPLYFSLNDPDPVDVIRKDSQSPLFLVCEHAGQAIPKALGGLGVSRDLIDSHNGWDIGAGELARALSERFDAPLVLQRYSRLVIDCNRPPDGPHAIPEDREGAPVPANQSLGKEARNARKALIFEPYDQAVEAGFSSHPRRVALAVHSFTRVFDGKERPWHAGFLARKDLVTPRRLRDHLIQAAPDLVLALNQPYQIDDDTDWFIPVHAEPRNLAHALIEVRNDMLTKASDVERFADLLAEAIATLPELSS